MRTSWGGAGSDDPSTVDDVDEVAVERGEVEVVQRGEHGQPAGAYQGQDLQLLSDVQVVGGFVQHQHLRLLSERAGDQDPLLLTAGEREESAVGQMTGADSLQGGATRPPVLVGGTGHRLLVRQPAHGHDLGHGEVELRGRFLRQGGEPTRAFTRVHGQQVVAAETDRAGRGTQGPVDAPQQGRLTTPVGPDEPHELAAARP
ncbi:hypothetical protein GCM10027073_56570 [Streptomyces chlorus]